jgi:hypothetical protein
MAPEEIEEIEDSDVARVKSAINTLSEHFDTVQIFCTRHEAGELDGTITAQFGSGNWYARYGQVQEWINIQQENAAIKARTP